MSNLTVYIDESGTLPDPADTVVVVAAVGIEQNGNLDALLKKVKKKAFLKKPGGELKFYTAGEKTKVLFFELLRNESFIICALTVDKMGRKIPDTPDHYAGLCLLLLRDVFRVTTNVGTLIFDRHFSRPADLTTFNHVLYQFINKEVRILHVNSAQNQRVNVADMVAGAILAKESGKDMTWYRYIRQKVARNRRVNWKTVKTHLLAIKKLA